MKVEGIVISRSKYKDYNAMITVLTKDNLLSFQAYGAYKPFTKNFPLVHTFMYANLVFSDSKKYLSIKEVDPIIDSREFFGTPILGCTINALDEIVLKLLLDEDKPKIYPYLVASIRKLHSLMSINSYLAMSPLLITLCNAIKIAGYGLEINKCVITGSTKDIVGISLIEGGLVSKQAFDPNKHIKYSPEKIAILRVAFKVKFIDMKDYDFNPHLTREIIKDLLIYIKDVMNTDLKQVALIDYLTL